MVSVPYGVFVFLNWVYLFGMHLDVGSFRPLRGLRISQSRQRLLQVERYRRFPSPTGSSYFSIRFTNFPLRGTLTVSVPYGVFVFLNSIQSFKTL